MASPNQTSTHGSSQNVLWVILCLILAFLVLLASAPTLILGFLAERYTSRYRWSFPFWFLLLFPSAFAFSFLYSHGLNSMITHELVDYIQTLKHSQTDFTQWNFPRLWSVTWPVWIRVLVAFPCVGFWQEVSLHARGGVRAEINGAMPGPRVKPGKHQQWIKISHDRIHCIKKAARQWNGPCRT